MSQLKKPSVVGPLVIGCLVIVAAGASVYAGYQAHDNEKNINQVKGLVIENSNMLKSIQADITYHTSLLKKGGGADLQGSVAEALINIENDKVAEAQANLYKNWDASGESKDGHHMYGNPSARFTLINYSDLECPFCKRFHETPKYLVDSAKNGMVNWVWRHFPLSFHEPMASKAAMMGECVAQQKGSKGFWAFTEYWFTNSAGNGQGFAGSDKIPELFGLNKEQYESCLTDPVIIKKIKDDMQAGNVAGVTGTPATIVIDNETGKTETIVGAQPFAKFVQVIEGMAHPERAQAQETAPPAQK
ncbi:Protein-disulfide isomerase [Providencia rustigianii]|uniref:Protein-disulfide isomerase n=1 Tax=Providencia rustigianii TaxID=158850 RepID=A0A379FY89_9GAMM|nr:DsbA family protein [Providencia rustigianii]SUC33720.1 Protein-disulfide isomerase [Providencia rustigianii]